MKKEETISCLLLFCSLILVKNTRATQEDLVETVSLVGNAKSLAREFANPVRF